MFKNMKMMRSNKTGYYITMHLAVLFTNSIYVQALRGLVWLALGGHSVCETREFPLFSPGSSWLICWPLSKPLAALDRRHITNYPLDGTCGVCLYSLAFSLPKTHTSKHSRIVDGSKWIYSPSPRKHGFRRAWMPHWILIIPEVSPMLYQCPTICQSRSQNSDRRKHTYTTC